MKLVKRASKKALMFLIICVILSQIMSLFHAYKFTHYGAVHLVKTKNAQQLSVGSKIKAIVFGINNPRPGTNEKPDQNFQTITLQSNKKIECWRIDADSSKGTVIIFHGYSGAKSLMIDKSDEFLKLGYNTLMVDFMGSGGSEGNQTTLGFKEAEEVKTCFEYIRSTGEKNVYLYGTSMGAVAIMKAINDFSLEPKGIILECPYGSIYKTTCARFRNMGIPSFPMVGFLVFWGGIQNGFRAFSLKPTEYAKNIKCPALLLYGEKDEEVCRSEINEIVNNMSCQKQLITFPLAKHENYLISYKKEWKENVKRFFEQ